MLEIAIIGCGRIAANHIAAIKKIDGARIAAVCDHTEPKVQKFAAELGCKGYTDAETMFKESKIDAAIICVPTFVHEEYVKICAKYGVAVLCEKPITRTTGACERMIKAVKDSGIIFMAAQVVRFWPGYVEIKKMMEKGEFGNVYMIRFRRVTSRDDAIAGWLNMPKQGGGAIHDMLVHDVDYLRYIGGPFERCYANAIKDETGCYNNVMANIECKNGIRAMAEASFTMQTGYPFSFSISIIGSEATLEYDYHAGIRIADTDEEESRFRIWRKGKGLEEPEIEYGDAFERQMRYFLDCVKNKKYPTLITPDESFEVIHLVDALHESAHSGQAIKIDEYEGFDFRADREKYGKQ